MATGQPIADIVALVTAHQEQSKTLRSVWDVEITTTPLNNKELTDAIAVGERKMTEVVEPWQTFKKDGTVSVEEAVSAVEKAKTWLMDDFENYFNVWREREEEGDQKQIYVNANEIKLKIAEQQRNKVDVVLNLKNKVEGEEWKGSWGG